VDDVCEQAEADVSYEDKDQFVRRFATELKQAALDIRLGTMGGNDQKSNRSHADWANALEWVADRMWAGAAGWSLLNAQERERLNIITPREIEDAVSRAQIKAKAETRSEKLR
jgi:hypothetical protein